MRTKFSALKREKELPSEEEDKKPSKKTKSFTVTSKVQSSLAGFFGLQIKQKFHGEARHEDFPGDKIHIWHWNINGLKSVVDKGLLQKFMKETDPDIVCFNEIKTDEEKIMKGGFHKQIPDGYEQYWNCSKTKKGYAGTAILTKVKPLSVEFDIGVSKHDEEGRVVTAEFQKFVLVAVYVPNSGDHLQRLKYRTEEWDRDFFDYLDKLRSEKKKPLIVTGDLNVAREPIDIYDAKGKEKIACFTPQERASFEGFLKRGFVDVYRFLYPEKQEFTYFSLRTRAKPVNKGWRIDYFIID